MSEATDKKTVRVYLDRLYRKAEEQDDLYAMNCLNMIAKVLNRLWGYDE